MTTFMAGLAGTDKRTHVLVVEDEPDICILVAEALTEQGFEVQAAPDAGTAVRYLNSGKPVDILFTDIDLPGGMDGAALAKYARALRPELPVMYTSGKRPKIEHLEPVKGAMFLPKPYDAFDLGRLLDRLITAEGVKQVG
jgi:CheY-like chemotaxis protein